MKDLLSSLNDSYEYVMHSTHSNFYRELYQDTPLPHITSLQDWRALPELTKEHIGSVPLTQRLFTPVSTVRHIRLTSGTSGGRPIAFPRNRISPIDAYISCTSAPQCSLWFFNPTYNFTLALQQAGFVNTRVIAGDVQNLAATARLSIAASVDHISCTVSQLQALLPYLQAVNYTANITHIDLSGERLSLAQKEYFYSSFPNARIGMLYGLTETQSMPGVCPDIRQDTRYRATNDFYLEINSTGELLVTHLHTAHNCFPLIRYNTRDTAEIVEKNGQQYFTIFGRSNLDMIKIPGGAIMTPQVEAALYRLHPHLTTEFELHYSATPKPTVEIKIQKKPTTSCDATTINTLRDTIAKKLKVSPSYTYDNGIVDTIYNPITLTLVDSLPQTTAKKVRLFVH